MLLDAVGIEKTFGPQKVLRGVSLALDAGQSVALTGDSGSGKSTLIHILAGLDRPDAGVLKFDGQDMLSMKEADRAALRRHDIGIVFQQFNLIPSLSAGANLRFQAEISGRFDREWVDQLAARLGLADHLGKYPEELSGGQQQRVAIGRAVAARPRFVLADEPTGNLDETTADTTLELLLDLVTTSGAGLIMATHSTARAARLGRAMHLRHGVFE